MCINIYAYIYIYTHTRTYIHIYIYIHTAWMYPHSKRLAIFLSMAVCRNVA